jgi:hypothetical protein
MSHKGAGDGKSIAKGDGNVEAWIESCSKKITCNIGQSYTFRERY